MDPGGSKKTIECVYQLFKKISCGADGSVSGINGSIRPSCLAHVLDALIVNGSELIDYGAGDGRVLVASLAKGASRAHGYELPANGAHQFVLNAVLEKIREHAWGRVHWISKNVPIHCQMFKRQCQFTPVPIHLLVSVYPGYCVFD